MQSNSATLAQDGLREGARYPTTGKAPEAAQGPGNQKVDPANMRPFEPSEPSDVMQDGWYAVYTNIHCEERAAMGLTEAGYQVFMPTFRRWLVRARTVKPVRRPTFPRYIFVAFLPEARPSRAVTSVDGVERLIKVRVPEQLVSGMMLDDLMNKHSKEPPMSRGDARERRRKAKISPTEKRRRLRKAERERRNATTQKKVVRWLNEVLAKSTRT